MINETIGNGGERGGWEQRQAADGISGEWHAPNCFCVQRRNGFSILGVAVLSGSAESLERRLGRRVMLALPRHSGSLSDRAGFKGWKAKQSSSLHVAAR